MTRLSLRGQRGAFTLVELLLVIGIIVILIALLLPALSRARAQALSTRCAANLHQIYVAQVLYSDQSKGKFTTVDFGPIQAKWILRLSPFLVKTGLPSDALQHCPAVNLDQLEPPNQWLPPEMSYGVNSHVMLPQWLARRAAKMDSSRIILMGDKALNYDDWMLSEDGCYYTAAQNMPAIDGVTVRYMGHRGASSRRHGNGRLANMVMVDGHVEPFDAQQLKEHSGHWYFGSPNLQLQEVPYCPCCPTQ
jgi:prepilin-type processing-associated H-X9-DG protein